MDYVNVPVTKFADTCLIPRPSMTQLLKGRNKKVSDEVISKIHNAYPDLSVMWLLFGEGDMLNNSNIKISEPQISTNPEQDARQNIDFQFENSMFPDFISESNNFQSRTDTAIPDDSFKQHQPKSAINPHSPTTNSFRLQENETPAEKACPSPKEKRHVVNIMVFYSDNSFESFVPQSKQN